MQKRSPSQVSIEPERDTGPSELHHIADAVGVTLSLIDGIVSCITS